MIVVAVKEGESIRKRETKLKAIYKQALQLSEEA
jgi:hypothetical protein